MRCLDRKGIRYTNRHFVRNIKSLGAVPACGTPAALMTHTCQRQAPPWKKCMPLSKKSQRKLKCPSKSLTLVRMFRVWANHPRSEQRWPPIPHPTRTVQTLRETAAAAAYLPTKRWGSRIAPAVTANVAVVVDPRLCCNISIQRDPTKDKGMISDRAVVFMGAIQYATIFELRSQYSFNFGCIEGTIVEMLFRFFICPHSSPFVIRLKKLTDHWLSIQFGAANWINNQ